VPLDAYGVLSAKPAERTREGSTDTPHYQVDVVDDGRHPPAQAQREGWTIVL